MSTAVSERGGVNLNPGDLDTQGGGDQKGAAVAMEIGNEGEMEEDNSSVSSYTLNPLPDSRRSSIPAISRSGSVKSFSSSIYDTGLTAVEMDAQMDLPDTGEVTMDMYHAQDIFQMTDNLMKYGPGALPQGQNNGANGVYERATVQAVSVVARIDTKDLNNQDDNRSVKSNISGVSGLTDEWMTTVDQAFSEIDRAESSSTGKTSTVEQYERYERRMSFDSGGNVDISEHHSAYSKDDDVGDQNGDSTTNTQDSGFSASTSFSPRANAFAPIPYKKQSSGGATPGRFAMRSSGTVSQQVAARSAIKENRSGLTRAGYNQVSQNRTYTPRAASKPPQPPPQKIIKIEEKQTKSAPSPATPATPEPTPSPQVLQTKQVEAEKKVVKSGAKSEDGIVDIKSGSVAKLREQMLIKLPLTSPDSTLERKPKEVPESPAKPIVIKEKPQFSIEKRVEIQSLSVENKENITPIKHQQDEKSNLTVSAALSASSTDGRQGTFVSSAAKHERSSSTETSHMYQKQVNKSKRQLTPSTPGEFRFNTLPAKPKIGPKPQKETGDFEQKSQTLPRPKDLKLSAFAGSGSLSPKDEVQMIQSGSVSKLRDFLKDKAITGRMLDSSAISTPAAISRTTSKASSMSLEELSKRYVEIDVDSPQDDPPTFTIGAEEAQETVISKVPTIKVESQVNPPMKPMLPFSVADIKTQSHKLRTVQQADSSEDQIQRMDVDPPKPDSPITKKRELETESAPQSQKVARVSSESSSVVRSRQENMEALTRILKERFPEPPQDGATVEVIRRESSTRVSSDENTRESQLEAARRTSNIENLVNVLSVRDNPKQSGQETDSKIEMKYSESESAEINTTNKYTINQDLSSTALESNQNVTHAKSLREDDRFMMALNKRYSNAQKYTASSEETAEETINFEVNKSVESVPKPSNQNENTSTTERSDKIDNFVSLMNAKYTEGDTQMESGEEKTSSIQEASVENQTISSGSYQRKDSVDQAKKTENIEHFLDVLQKRDSTSGARETSSEEKTEETVTYNVQQSVESAPIPSGSTRNTVTNGRSDNIEHLVGLMHAKYNSGESQLDENAEGQANFVRETTVESSGISSRKDSIEQTKKSENIESFLTVLNKRYSGSDSRGISGDKIEERITSDVQQRVESTPGYSNVTSYAGNRGRSKAVTHELADPDQDRYASYNSSSKYVNYSERDMLEETQRSRQEEYQYKSPATYTDTYRDETTISNARDGMSTRERKRSIENLVGLMNKKFPDENDDSVFSTNENSHQVGEAAVQQNLTNWVDPKSRPPDVISRDRKASIDKLVNLLNKKYSAGDDPQTPAQSHDQRQASSSGLEISTTEQSTVGENSSYSFTSTSDELYASREAIRRAKQTTNDRRSSDGPLREFESDKSRRRTSSGLDDKNMLLTDIPDRRRSSRDTRISQKSEASDGYNRQYTSGAESTLKVPGADDIDAPEDKVNYSASNSGSVRSLRSMYKERAKLTAYTFEQPDPTAPDTPTTRQVNPQTNSASISQRKSEFDNTSRTSAEALYTRQTYSEPKYDERGASVGDSPMTMEHLSQNFDSSPGTHLDVGVNPGANRENAQDYLKNASEGEEITSSWTGYSERQQTVQSQQQTLTQEDDGEVRFRGQSSSASEPLPSQWADNSTSPSAVRVVRHDVQQQQYQQQQQQQQYQQQQQQQQQQRQQQKQPETGQPLDYGREHLLLAPGIDDISFKSSQQYEERLRAVGDSYVLDNSFSRDEYPGSLSPTSEHDISRDNYPGSLSPTSDSGVRIVNFSGERFVTAASPSSDGFHAVNVVSPTVINSATYNREQELQRYPDYNQQPRLSAFRTVTSEFSSTNAGEIGSNITASNFGSVTRKVDGQSSHYYRNQFAASPIDVASVSQQSYQSPARARSATHVDTTPYFGGTAAYAGQSSVRSSGSLITQISLEGERSQNAVSPAHIDDGFASPTRVTTNGASEQIRRTQQASYFLTPQHGVEGDYLSNQTSHLEQRSSTATTPVHIRPTTIVVDTSDSSRVRRLQQRPSSTSTLSVSSLSSIDPTDQSRVATVLNIPVRAYPTTTGEPALAEDHDDSLTDISVDIPDASNISMSSFHKVQQVTTVRNHSETRQNGQITQLSDESQTYRSGSPIGSLKNGALHINSGKSPLSRNSGSNASSNTSKGGTLMKVRDTDAEVGAITLGESHPILLSKGGKLNGYPITIDTMQAQRTSPDGQLVSPTVYDNYPEQNNNNTSKYSAGVYSSKTIYDSTNFVPQDTNLTVRHAQADYSPKTNTYPRTQNDANSQKTTMTYIVPVTEVGGEHQFQPGNFRSSPYATTPRKGTTAPLHRQYPPEEPDFPMPFLDNVGHVEIDGHDGISKFARTVPVKQNKRKVTAADYDLQSQTMFVQSHNRPRSRTDRPKGTTAGQNREHGVNANTRNSPGLLQNRVQKTFYLHVSPDDVGITDVEHPLQTLPQEASIPPNDMGDFSFSVREKYEPQHPGVNEDFTVTVVDKEHAPFPKRRPRKSSIDELESADIEEWTDVRDVNQNYVDAENMKVDRSNFLITNSIDTTSAPKVIDLVEDDETEEDILVDDNVNLFHSKFYQTRENPMYSSDPDLTQIDSKIQRGERSLKGLFTPQDERISPSKAPLDNSPYRDPQFDEVDGPIQYNGVEVDEGIIGPVKVSRDRSAPPMYGEQNYEYEERLEGSARYNGVQSTREVEEVIGGPIRVNRDRSAPPGGDGRGRQIFVYSDNHL